MATPPSELWQGFAKNSEYPRPSKDRARAPGQRMPERVAGIRGATLPNAPRVQVEELQHGRRDVPFN
jgi:hypothetical protein